MARPKKQHDKRKNRIIGFRLTDAEFAVLAQAAAKANVRLNELARLLALSGERRLVVKVSAACDPALLKRLERIGHNLNQLVRNAHILGRIPPGIPELCGQIEAIVAEAMAQEWDS